MTRGRRSQLRALGRGLLLRCPRCGRGRLFGRRLRLRSKCAACALRLDVLGHDTWAMIYFSTAAMTGLVLIGVITVRPAHFILGRLGLAVVAFVLIVASLPSRKGMAIAINYLIGEHRSSDDRELPSH